MSYTLVRRCTMRPTGSPEELERRRVRALALLKEGLLPVEVARRVGVDRRFVRRPWAPRGHSPVLMQRGRSRSKVSVIGALVISPRRRRVRAYFGLLPDANFDGESILAFVMQLCRALRAALFLIWDRLGAHIGEPVATWLMRNRHRVRAHLLPPYAPELNPVELIWGHTKSNPL